MSKQDHRAVLGLEVLMLLLISPLLIVFAPLYGLVWGIGYLTEKVLDRMS